MDNPSTDPAAAPGAARKPLKPLDAMRAYRACLNCRNRKSRCDLAVNAGKPASEADALEIRDILLTAILAVSTMSARESGLYSGRESSWWSPGQEDVARGRGRRRRRR